MSAGQRALVQRTVSVTPLEGDPPARDDDPRARGFDWLEHVVRPLVQAPGVWHRIEGAPYVSALAVTYGRGARSAQHRSPWRPVGAFEARRSDGVLFVRYVGTPLAAWAPEVGDARELRHLWRLAPHPERWRAYSSPERVLALLGEGLASRPPRMDPSSPPPDATTALRCAYCTWRPARGLANDRPSCGVEVGHPAPFEPDPYLPDSQVHGEPEGPPPTMLHEVVVEPATPPALEPLRTIDLRDLASWEWADVRQQLDAVPGAWHRILGAPASYSTRINRGRIVALRRVQARSRGGVLELRAWSS